MQDKPQIAFVLALVGGLISLGTAVMMGLFLLVFASFLVAVPDGAFPLPFMGILFGWLALTGLIGGVLMLVAAPKLRRPDEAKDGRTLAFVGGGAAILGGNMLAGALGIVAGALLLEGHPPR